MRIAVFPDSMILECPTRVLQRRMLSLSKNRMLSLSELIYIERNSFSFLAVIIRV